MTEPPVEPSLAATVVLVRPGRAGLEILLTKRPASMAFAGDMYVFPGGRVDPADAEPSLLARSMIGPAEAARALGGDLPPEIALAAHVAAIRELFEEAGVLLADRTDDPGPADGTAPPVALPARSVALARSALVGGEATFEAIAAELDLWLRTDLLVPLSRWVTPPILPRRFDARFFVAELPSRARVSFEGDEVAGHTWLTATGALQAMAADEIAMWLPTCATLQQLAHATSVVEIREHLTPGPLATIEVEQISPEVTRIVMPAGGGVAGHPVYSYLVGRRSHVLVDPGDPTGPALDRAMELAAARGGSIAAIALTHADPDHAGGAEALALVLGIPVLGGPGAGRAVPYAVDELADLAWLSHGDVPMRAVFTPGPSPEHVAFIVGDLEDSGFAISGDLDGRRGARSIVGPVDPRALRSSVDRVRELAPAARWLGGHPGEGPDG